MRGWTGLVGTFIPFVVLVAACWSPLKSRRLWSLSLLANLFSWLCFAFLVVGFFTKETTGLAFVVSPYILEKNIWTGALGLRWDFQNSVLLLAASTVVVCYHFLARITLEKSRSSVAALGAYLGCLLGALGAGHLFLFAVFFAGSLVSRFVFNGVEAEEKGIGAVKETAFLGILALFSLFVVVLVFYGPFRASLGGWFQLAGGSHVVLPGSIGFSLLLFAAAVGSGIFPFHGNARRSYEINSMERSVPMALQPLFGFTLLFRFAVELFPAEFRQFGPIFLALLSLGLAFFALSFLGSKMARDRVFWLQQFVSFLVAIGFFSLSQKGWHGASTLLLFQSLAIPFFLIVLTCHARREVLSLGKITTYPIFAFSTVWAVLFALFLPVSIGFYGVLLVIWSLVPTGGWFLPFVIASVPIIALAGMNSMFFDLGGRRGSGDGKKFHDLTFEEILSILPIGAVLLFLGLMPKILMGPLGASTAALLRGMGIQN